MGFVIPITFPLSDGVLEECLVRMVEKCWDYAEDHKGISLAQAVVYVEQDLDRPVDSVRVWKALERLVESGKLSKDIGVSSAYSVNTVTGEKRKKGIAVERYFPVA